MSEPILPRSPRKPAAPRRKRALLPQSGSRRHTLESVIASIQRDGDWPRIVELYYWSREPGMLDVIRMIMTMPESARASLEAFCAMVYEPQEIAANLDSEGRLTMSSQHVGHAAAIIQRCDEDPEKPLRLN